MMAARRINGRRRPKREADRSDFKPINGWTSSATTAPIAESQPSASACCALPTAPGATKSKSCAGMTTGSRAAVSKLRENHSKLSVTCWRIDSRFTSVPSPAMAPQADDAHPELRRPTVAPHAVELAPAVAVIDRQQRDQVEALQRPCPDVG